VREVRFNPPFTDSDFQFETKAGMMIKELHFPESPNRLFLPPPRARNYRGGAEGWIASFTSGWSIGQTAVWTLAALIATLSIVSWLLRKRWKRHT
jgi:hypothetical protein